jgi:hypothetical protein
MTQIFLAYAREDEAQVRGVYRRLLNAGFEGEHSLILTLAVCVSDDA